MHLSTLSQCLTWIETLHTKEIELGLDRVKKVAMSLNLLTQECPVIIVGGTNGKGSTVAAIESIYQAAGFKTGAYTSPFIFKHNEIVRIEGVQATDEDFCKAYRVIAENLSETKLTPFEVHTLAAFIIFKQYELDVWILEVGLGGRLDAVNILDADVAITTSIGIDHIEWLGDTREAIGFEKAGIYRKGKPAVCGDQNPPLSLMTHAQKIDAPFYCLGKEFSFHQNETTWSWFYENKAYLDLPRNHLLTQNMATALMVVHLLQDQLPVSHETLKQGLRTVRLPGRMQFIHASKTQIVDVSHNPDSCKALAKKLTETTFSGKTIAVFSMLADKDIAQSLREIHTQINEWHVAALAVKRAASREQLEKLFQLLNIQNVTFYESIRNAYDTAFQRLAKSDRLLVFGSFHTVSEAYLKWEALS